MKLQKNIKSKKENGAKDQVERKCGYDENRGRRNKLKSGTMREKKETKEMRGVHNEG